MSLTAHDLLQQALHLSEAERATLAGALIESLHGPAEPGISEAWETEIQRRVIELESGSVETVPWSAVRAQLFDGFE
jgi:putative addiction module component (TIGR02574 family)